MSDATLAWQAQRINELEEEVRQLRDRLGRVPDTLQVVALRERLRIPACEARILLALRAGMASCTADRLADRAGVATGDTARVHVCRLRKRFGDEIIDTLSTGYAITVRGRRLVDDALSHVNARGIA